MLRLRWLAWHGRRGGCLGGAGRFGFSVAEAQEAMVPRSSVPQSSARWQASAPATHPSRSAPAPHQCDPRWPIIGALACSHRRPQHSDTHWLVSGGIEAGESSIPEHQIRQGASCDRSASPLGHRWISFQRVPVVRHPWNTLAALGKDRAAVSNGCVRMLNADVQKLYELVEVGTPVVIAVIRRP